MKKHLVKNFARAIVLASFICTPAVVGAQDYYEEDYTKKDTSDLVSDSLTEQVQIKEEFGMKFTSDEAKENFKELRIFKREKEEQEALYNKKEAEIGNRIEQLKRDKNGAEEQQSFYEQQETKLDEDIRKVNSSKPNFTDWIYQSRGFVDLQGNLIKDRKDDFLDYLNSLKQDTHKKIFILKGEPGKTGVVDRIGRAIEELKKTKILIAQNIENIQRDIHNCETAIDEALAPENKRQTFKTEISLLFSGIIAILIAAFFFIIYKRGGPNLSSILLSEGGLQFVTVFVLIIAIVLFGILGILEGRELAAILSGIAGYILGRGKQMAAPPVAPTGQTDPGRNANPEPAEKQK